MRILSRILILVTISITTHTLFIPTMPASAGTMAPTLAQTTSGVHLGMMFNWNLQGNTQLEVGVDDIVWAANSSIPFTNDPAPGVTHLDYYSWADDGQPGNGPGLAPFLNSHPDWIVYQADKHTPAWAGWSAPAAQNRAPLDYTNPAVQQYMMNDFITYPITQGNYAGIAFDACVTLNNFGRVGVYRSAGTLTASAAAGSTTIHSSASIPANTSISFGNASDFEYVTVTAASGTTLTVSPALKFSHATGEWLGQWKQQYDGNLLDTAFRQATITAFQQVVQRIKSANPSALVVINAIPATWSKETDQNGVHAWEYWRDLVLAADGVLDEGGLTLNAGGGGKSLPYITSDPNSSGIPNPWDLKIQDYQWASSLGKIVMIVNKEKYYVKTGMTLTNNQARFDLQWNLAGYLLAKGDNTYFVWRGLQQTPNDVYNEPEYVTAQAIGSPTDPMYQSQNVYMRDFSNGLAIENPSGKSTYTVTFPAGKYHDLYGNAISSYTMPPHSGLVLLG